MNTKNKVISFYPKPKKLELNKKNLKINYSSCIYENYKQAKVRIKINDFQSALILCNTILELNNSFIKAILLKVFIFFELKDYHRGFSNMLLVQEINSSLTLKILEKYYINCTLEKREEIKNKLKYFKKISHKRIYD